MATATNLHPLLDAIVKEIPAPRYTSTEPFQMLVSDLSYSDYFGRQAIGKVINGRAHSKDGMVCIGDGDVREDLNVTKLHTYSGVKLVEADSAEPGDIVVLSGIENVHIGDTICNREFPKALKRIIVDEPTVSMHFFVNTSPLSGSEGKNVQSGRLFDRLRKETLNNVSIQVEEVKGGGGFIVKGRGEFQLVILIEMLRREDFEVCVSRPEVILKHEKGKTLEPIEHLFVDCNEAFVGVVTEKLSARKGRMLAYTCHEGARVHLEFSVPSRALIGYRDLFLTDTKGTGIMNSYLSGYEEYRGDFIDRFTGSMVSDRERQGRHLRPVSPGAARPPVRRSRGPGLRGDDRRRAQPGLGAERESLQGEEALQHALGLEGRGADADAHPAPDPGTGNPVHPGR